jgi:hypothetical protein
MHHTPRIKVLGLDLLLRKQVPWVSVRALARALTETGPDLEISVLLCKTRSMILDLIRTTAADHSCLDTRKGAEGFQRLRGRPTDGKLTRGLPPFLESTVGTGAVAQLDEA